MYQENRTQS